MPSLLRFLPAVFLMMSCTGRGNAPPQQTKEAPVAGPKAAASDDVGEGAPAFGEACQTFLSGVAKACPKSNTQGPCEQLQARVQELNALKPGSDGTHKKYDWLCEAEMTNLRKVQ